MSGFLRSLARSFGFFSFFVCVGKNTEEEGKRGEKEGGESLIRVEGLPC